VGHGGAREKFCGSGMGSRHPPTRCASVTEDVASVWAGCSKHIEVAQEGACALPIRRGLPAKELCIRSLVLKKNVRLVQ
jgi:hypothetical protein